jgi:hypothetical protein
VVSFTQGALNLIWQCSWVSNHNLKRSSSSPFGALSCHHHLPHFVSPSILDRRACYHSGCQHARCGVTLANSYVT